MKFIASIFSAASLFLACACQVFVSAQPLKAQASDAWISSQNVDSKLGRIELKIVPKNGNKTLRIRFTNTSDHVIWIPKSVVSALAGGTINTSWFYLGLHGRSDEYFTYHYMGSEEASIQPGKSIEFDLKTELIKGGFESSRIIGIEIRATNKSYPKADVRGAFPIEAYLKDSFTVSALFVLN